MNDVKNNHEEHINILIAEYGRLDFLEQALNEQKVTRHLIIHARYMNMYKTIFFSMISLGVLSFGLAGLFDVSPKELSFLIPIGLIMLWAVRKHSRKVKKALHELSHLAVGIHAKKLAEM